jgi:predicted permease
VGNLLSDVRYCLRGFARRPLFAGVVVVTLAVGIGVNVALYAIFAGMLLRPVPAANAPERLVNLAAPGPKEGNTSCDLTGDCQAVFSYPMFRDLERVQAAFDGIAAHRLIDTNLAFRGNALPGTGVLVSGSYFGVLAVQPTLGRLLGPQDDAVEGFADSVVLSYPYWQNALGGDPGVVGQALVVNGKPLTIVGVAAPEFQGAIRPTVPDVFVPITFQWRDTPGAIQSLTDRRNHWVYLFARLKPGVSAAEAEAAINPEYRAILAEVEAPLQRAMSAEVLAQFRAKSVTVTPSPQGQSLIVSGGRVPLTILLVAAAAVLLIACVNIANLMLARGTARSGEMAVRLSMGAAPYRLLLLLFTEALLLALLAAAVSLPLTHFTLRWIKTMVPAQGAASFEFGVTAGLVGVAVGAALLCALTFALAPVLKLARTQPARVLHSQGTRSTGGKAANRFRVALVTAQIAMSMMLLALAGLLAQSQLNITRVDLGIRTESLVSFWLSPERNGYTVAESAALFERVEREVVALPGVTAVASSLVTLLSGRANTNEVRVEGFEPRPGTLTLAHINGVSPGFFAALGIPLHAGRDFRATDAGLDKPDVGIVNERFVEFYGLGANAVGTRIGVGPGSTRDVEIVGIVADAKYDNVKDPVRPQLFRPREQIAGVGEATFYVRHGAAQDAVLAGIRAAVARLDPTLPVASLHSVDAQVRENVFLDRFMGKLAAALAVLATSLAAVGLYGVLSYMVAQRTREIGLRMALGAPPERARSMVLKQVGFMAVIGGVLGIGAAVLLGQVARVVLFGVQATDPVVLLTAAGVLGSIVLVAGYLPARRASRVDPIVALRAE